MYLHSDLLKASDPASSPGVLAGLAGSSDVDVRVAVAGNVSCPPDVLVKLATDRTVGRDGVEVFYRLRVSGSRNLGWNVRAAVAGNVSAPSKVLGFLARDHMWEVRRMVAGNVSTPYPVLLFLARDSSVAVLVSVAGNPGLGRLGVLKFLSSPHPQVASAALYNSCLFDGVWSVDDFDMLPSVLDGLPDDRLCVFLDGLFDVRVSLTGGVRNSWVRFFKEKYSRVYDWALPGLESGSLKSSGFPRAGGSFEEIGF